MNQKNKEALKKLRKQLENSGGGQKYTLLVGNGFNKYQFGYNKQHDPDNCDWEAVINSVASSNEVKKHASANPGLQGKIDRILDMPGIHPAERGIFLFNLLEESKFEKSKTIGVVKEIIKKFTITPPYGKNTINDSLFTNCNLLDLIWDNGHHILTTNFDNNLENYFTALHGAKIKPCQIVHGIRKSASKSSEGKAKSPAMEGMETGRRFWSPRRFQWETFYGEGNSTSWESLSHDIWHIHGNLVKKAFSSVLFSTEDYFNAVSHFRNISGNPLKEDWKGNYTWLKLFMESPLIIAGLGLDEGELLLRHLLMVRRKYRHLKELDEKEYPSCFLYTPSKEEDKTNAGKRDVSRKLLQDSPNPFLDLMGFECIQFDSYDKLYDLNS